MCCNYTMMSPKVTSPEEEEGADVDGVERDEVEREGELLNPTVETETTPRYA